MMAWGRTELPSPHQLYFFTETSLSRKRTYNPLDHIWCSSTVRFSTIRLASSNCLRQSPDHAHESAHWTGKKGRWPESSCQIVANLWEYWDTYSSFSLLDYILNTPHLRPRPPLDSSKSISSGLLTPATIADIGLWIWLFLRRKKSLVA